MFRSPKMAGLPALSLMLADLPAHHDQIARHLGISPRTLANYVRAGQAPRAVMLALFWETRWGRSAADTEAANFAAIHYRRAQITERRNAALLHQIGVLEGELTQAGNGAANAPIYRVG
ncbi:MAG: hypothetical protein WB542_18165 [Polaromonas sp.]